LSIPKAETGVIYRRDSSSEALTPTKKVHDRWANLLPCIVRRLFNLVCSLLN